MNQTLTDVFKFVVVSSINHLKPIIICSPFSNSLNIVILAGVLGTFGVRAKVLSHHFSTSVNKNVEKSP